VAQNTHTNFTTQKYFIQRNDVKKVVMTSFYSHFNLFLMMWRL